MFGCDWVSQNWMMITERQPLFILDSKVGALAKNLLDIAVGGGGCEVDAKHIGPENLILFKNPFKQLL